MRKNTLPLNVNGKVLPASYYCVQVGSNRIEHFQWSMQTASMPVAHLNSDFTLLLQNDIKIWAANIKSPKYGLTPRFKILLRLFVVSGA